MNIGSDLPVDNYCPQTVKKDSKSCFLQDSGSKNDQMGRYICAQSNSPRKKNLSRHFKFRPRTRAMASNDLTHDSILRGKMTLNTTRQKYQIGLQKGGTEYKSVARDEAARNIFNSNSKLSNDDNKGSGIKLYQPMKRKTK